MNQLTRLAVLVVFLSALVFPLSAFALTPVGGFVTAVRPCNTGYLITVVNPAGLGSGEFMWTPGTLDYLWGPPIFHRWVLGMTDVPLACVVGHVLIGFGQRITFDGTSPL